MAEALRRSLLYAPASVEAMVRKAAIHPGQVAPINQVFSPTAAEVRRAQAIEAALLEGAGRGRGVALLDGELVEGLHLAHARRLLRRAARLGLLPGPEGRN